MITWAISCCQNLQAAVVVLEPITDAALPDFAVPCHALAAQLYFARSPLPIKVAFALSCR